MLDILRNVSLFRYLNDPQLEMVNSLCLRKGYKNGTILFRENEPGSTFYIILAGSVKIYTSSQANEEKILSIFGPGEYFGELSLIDKKPRSASAQCIEDTVLLSITGEELKELLKKQFDITESILVELCSRLRDTNQHVHDLTFLNEPTRVIKSLIQMAQKNGQRSGNTITFKVALNYDELSRMAGVQKNELMAVIRDLQTKSILTFSGNDFVLDLSKLRA